MRTLLAIKFNESANAPVSVIRHDAGVFIARLVPKCFRFFHDITR